MDFPGIDDITVNYDLCCQTVESLRTISHTLSQLKAANSPLTSSTKIDLFHTLNEWRAVHRNLSLVSFHAKKKHEQKLLENMDSMSNLQDNVSAKLETIQNVIDTMHMLSPSNGEFEKLMTFEEALEHCGDDESLLHQPKGTEDQRKRFIIAVESKIRKNFMATLNNIKEKTQLESGTYEKEKGFYKTQFEEARRLVEAIKNNAV